MLKLPLRSLLHNTSFPRRNMAPGKIAQSASATRNGKPGPRSVSIGLIGLGTVGAGTVKVLLEHQRELERRLGCKLKLKTICSRSIVQRDLSWLGQPVEITPDWKQVVRDPEIDIVIELVGKLPTARAIAQATSIWELKPAWPGVLLFFTRSAKVWQASISPPSTVFSTEPLIIF